MLPMAHDELCVCELIHALAAAQPPISSHLAQLGEVGNVDACNSLRIAGVVWAFLCRLTCMLSWALVTNCVGEAAPERARRSPPG